MESITEFAKKADISLPECELYLAKYEQSKPSREEAKGFAYVLIESLPVAEFNNETIFAKQLTESFLNYPKDCALRAIDRLTKTCKFKVRRAHLEEALQFENEDNYKMLSFIKVRMGILKLREKGVNV